MDIHCYLVITVWGTCLWCSHFVFCKFKVPSEFPPDVHLCPANSYKKKIWKRQQRQGWLWTFGGIYKCFLPSQCPHFGQTRLNQNIHNTIYHSMKLTLHHCVHFPECTTALGAVTSWPELMTNQNSSQDLSVQGCFRLDASGMRAATVLKCVYLYLTSCFKC